MSLRKSSSARRTATLPRHLVREISEGNSVVESFKERLNGRYSLHDVHDPATGELLVSKER